VVEILGVELLGAHFSRRDSTQLPVAAEGAEAFPAFGLNAVWKRSDDGTMLGCNVTFATDFGEDPEPPYQLVASFRLTYSLPADSAFSEDELDNFANWNVVFNAWPYWREYLSSTINRANLPRFAVPVMKLPISGGAQITK